MCCECDIITTKVVAMFVYIVKNVLCTNNMYYTCTYCNRSSSSTSCTCFNVVLIVILYQFSLPALDAYCLLEVYAYLKCRVPGGFQIEPTLGWVREERKRIRRLVK